MPGIFTFQCWLNPGNTTDTTGATPGLQGPFTTAPIADPAYATVPLTGAPFSLVNQLIFSTPTAITLADTGTTQLTAVPEPASMALVLGAAPVAGLALWRRRRRARA